MAVTVTIYPQSITWNSITWDKSNHGPLAVTYQHSGEPLEDRTGDNEYAPFLAVVNKIARATVRLRTTKQTLALGTSSSLAMTLSGKGGTTSTVTIPGMILYDVSGNQDRAAAGSVELSFAHESSDGSTNPVS